MSKRQPVSSMKVRGDLFAVGMLSDAIRSLNAALDECKQRKIRVLISRNSRGRYRYTATTPAEVS